jgi:hypothetical protein
MTDYRPLLARAIAALDPNTGEARRAVYDRARTALVNQLRGMNPPLAEADITRQRLALEDAIRKVEGEATAAPAPNAGAQTQSRPNIPPPPRPAPQAPRSAPLPTRTAPLPQPRTQTEVRGEQAAPMDEQEPFEPVQAPPSRDPRMQRNGGRPDPREQSQPRQEPSLRPRGARGRADYVRDDARRASRTRLVVFGIIFVLMLLASAVGYVHRDRILSLVAGNLPGGQQEETPAPSPNKANDRVPQQQTQQQPPAPLSPTQQQPVGAGNRAILFEENPGTQQFTAINGTVTWRTETVSPGPGRSPELGVRAEVDIPERKMKVVFSVRRNPEGSSSASHYVEIQFSGSDGFGGIAQVPVIRLKNNENAQGFPLAGISIRIVQGLFLIGLSAVDTDRDRNLQALRTQPWIDIPFVYDNGRRSVIAFEKGPAGEKAMAEAFAAWGG